MKQQAALEALVRRGHAHSGDRGDGQREWTATNDAVAIGRLLLADAPRGRVDGQQTLRELLADAGREHGPIPADVQSEVDALWA